jgi:Peptidase A4 family
MVGLDGDGLQDLVPPGTQYVTIWSQVFQITLHSAWTEYLQDQQTEQVIAGLRVSGGDIISVDVEMLPDGSTASFVVYNETTNTYTTVQTASATRPGRTEADWIVERPTPNVGTPNQQFAAPRLWQHRNNSPARRIKCS